MRQPTVDHPKDELLQVFLIIPEASVRENTYLVRILLLFYSYESGYVWYH